MNDLIKSAGMCVLAVIVGLAMVEAAVRLVVDDGMRYDLEMWKYALEIKRVSENDDVGHEHRPNVNGHYMGVDVSTNETGQRDRPFETRKPSGVFRILMLGDSLTFGWGVPSEKTTSKRLESLLNSNVPGRKFEVINAGVGNYNAAMSISWFLWQGKAFDPDLIILNYFINDAEPTPRRQGGFLRESSYAYVYLGGRLDALWRGLTGQNDWLSYYRNLYDPSKPGWRQAREKVGALSAYAKERGIGLMLVNYPELRQLDPYPFEGVNRAIEALARKYDMPYLDLLAATQSQNPADLWVTVEDPHPNARANEIFAKAIYEWFRKRLKF